VIICVDQHLSERELAIQRARTSWPSGFWASTSKWAAGCNTSCTVYLAPYLRAVYRTSCTVHLAPRLRAVYRTSCTVHLAPYRRAVYRTSRTVCLAHCCCWTRASCLGARYTRISISGARTEVLVVSRARAQPAYITTSIATLFDRL